MKFRNNIIYVSVILIIAFTLAACSTNGISNQGLSEEEIEAEAIRINESCNLDFLMNGELYNVEYSISYEEDDYYRYIVQLHYQYETSIRTYGDGDSVVYFRYDPKEDEFVYSKDFPIIYPAIESDPINSIKEDEKFGWG